MTERKGAEQRIHDRFQTEFQLTDRENAFATVRKFLPIIRISSVIRTMSWWLHSIYAFISYRCIQCAVALLYHPIEYCIRGLLSVQRFSCGGNFCCCNTFINNIRKQQRLWFVLCWYFYYFGIESDVNRRTINSIVWLMFRAISTSRHKET